MKKNTIIFGFLTISAIALALGIRNHIQANTGLSEESLANLEAMGVNDTVPTPSLPPQNTEYDINRFQCTMHVGKDGHLGLFNGSILHADETGYVRVDGGQDCMTGGRTLCTPVTCAQIWQILIHGDQPATPPIP